MQIRGTKDEGTEKGRRLPGMRERGCWADSGGGGWEARWSCCAGRWFFSFSFFFFFPFSSLSFLSMFFSSLPSLYSSLFFSFFPLVFSLFLLFCFFFLFICFFLSIFFFSLSSFFAALLPFSALFSPVFIGKYMGREASYPCPVMAQGRVAGATTMHLPHDRPRGMSPLFFHPVIGHESELRQVGGLC